MWHKHEDSQQHPPLSLTLKNVAVSQINTKTNVHFGETTPQDQLIRDANICKHDLADQDCPSPQWHYSKQPVNMSQKNCLKN